MKTNNEQRRSFFSAPRGLSTEYEGRRYPEENHGVFTADF
jgi:hypothetical protein